MLSVATMCGGRILTTDRVREVTWPTVCLHKRNTAEGETETTMTCPTSSAIEMPTTGSKTGAMNETASNRSDAMKGTMIIMARSMTNLNDNAPLKEGIMKEESKPFLTT
jgi:hypothetical protein